MKAAFVIQLGPGTRPSERQFEGWAEEVDSGKEMRFHSLDELVRFIGERFEACVMTKRDRLDKGSLKNGERR